MALDLTPSSNSSTSIRAVRGQYNEIPITIYNAGGTARNITSDVIWFTVKSDPDSQLDSQAEIRKSSTNSTAFSTLDGVTKVTSTAGTALVVLNSSDTDPLAARTYYYDVKTMSTSDTKTYVVMSGPFILQRQVTRQPSGG